MTVFMPKPRSFSGPQLLFGWHPKNLERYGSGNGVVAYSADWPNEIGRSAGELGRLIRLWGDLRAEPSGIRSIRSRIRGCEFTKVGRWQIWIRKYPEINSQSGACFVHLVAISDQSFGMKEAVFADLAGGPVRSLSQVKYTIPSRELPHAVLEVSPPDSLDHAPGLGLGPAARLTLAATLSGLGKATMSLGLIADDPDEPERAFSTIAETIPGAMLATHTYATFAMPGDLEGLDAGGLLRPFVSGSGRGFETTVDLSQPDLRRTGRDAKNQLSLADLLLRLRQSGFRAPDSIDSLDRLRQWSDTARAILETPGTLEPETVLKALKFPDLTDRLMERPGIGETLLSYWSTDDRFAAHLSGIRDLIARDQIVEALAERAINDSYSKAQEAAQQLKVPLTILDGAIADRFVSLARSDRIAPPDRLNEIWAIASRHLEANDLPDLALSPMGREIIATTSDPILARAYFGDAARAHDRHRLEWVLGKMAPSTSTYVITDVIQFDVNAPEVEGLFVALGSRRTFDVLTFAVLTSHFEDPRAEQFLRQLLANRTAPEDWKNYALRRYWPDIARVLPIGGGWRSALTSSLTVAPLDRSEGQMAPSDVSFGVRPSRNRADPREHTDTRRELQPKRESWVARFFGHGK